MMLMRIKVVIYSVIWSFKNRKWRPCRHKRKAFERSLYRYRLQVGNNRRWW